jgi:hypothetical protein
MAKKQTQAENERQEELRLLQKIAMFAEGYKAGKGDLLPFGTIDLEILNRIIKKY